jgi:hypothetical protein
MSSSGSTVLDPPSTAWRLVLGDEWHWYKVHPGFYRSSKGQYALKEVLTVRNAWFVPFAPVEILFIK